MAEIQTGSEKALHQKDGVFNLPTHSPTQLLFHIVSSNCIKLYALIFSIADKSSAFDAPGYGGSSQKTEEFTQSRFSLREIATDFEMLSPFTFNIDSASDKKRKGQ